MAENTAVNNQITDAVTQVTTNTTGENPAEALANVFKAEQSRNSDEQTEPGSIPPQEKAP